MMQRDATLSDSYSSDGCSLFSQGCQDYLLKKRLSQEDVGITVRDIQDRTSAPYVWQVIAKYEDD